MNLTEQPIQDDFRADPEIRSRSLFGTNLENPLVLIHLLVKHFSLAKEVCKRLLPVNVLSASHRLKSR